MKIFIDEENKVDFHTLEDLKEYMKIHKNAILYYFDEEKSLAIEDNYINEMP